MLYMKKITSILLIFSCPIYAIHASTYTQRAPKQIHTKKKNDKTIPMAVGVAAGLAATAFILKNRIEGPLTQVWFIDKIVSFVFNKYLISMRGKNWGGERIFIFAVKLFFVALFAFRCKVGLFTSRNLFTFLRM